MHIARLRGRKIVEKVQDKGRFWKGRAMVARWLPGAPRHPAADPAKPGVYLGLLASSRLHKSAVKRNRMRRRCHEAMRLTLKETEAFGPVQVLISPRILSLTCPFDVIQKDAEQLLRIMRTSPLSHPSPSSAS